MILLCFAYIPLKVSTTIRNSCVFRLSMSMIPCYFWASLAGESGVYVCQNSFCNFLPISTHLRYCRRVQRILDPLFSRAHRLQAGRLETQQDCCAIREVVVGVSHETIRSGDSVSVLPTEVTKHTQQVLPATLTKTLSSFVEIPDSCRGIRTIGTHR